MLVATMSISEERLQEFIDIIEAETGKRISAEEATYLAHKFLHLYEFLYSPQPGEKRGQSPSVA